MKASALVLLSVLAFAPVVQAEEDALLLRSDPVEARIDARTGRIAVSVTAMRAS